MVDGKLFTSLNRFSNRKAAAQDVAKIALEEMSKRIKDCLSNKINDEGFPWIYEDTVFRKSIHHHSPCSSEDECGKACSYYCLVGGGASFFHIFF